MDHMPGGKSIAAGQLGLARRAAAEAAAFGEELGASGAMNGAIDPAAAEQRAVRRVHDRVDAKPRDITLFKAYAVAAGRIRRHRTVESNSWLRSLPNTRSSRIAPEPSSTMTLLGWSASARRLASATACSRPLNSAGASESPSLLTVQRPSAGCTR